MGTVLRDSKQQPAAVIQRESPGTILSLKITVSGCYSM